MSDLVYIFIIFTGGSDWYEFFDDVLIFNPKNSSWNKIGSLRSGHGASLVKMDDVFWYAPNVINLKYTKT